MGRFHVSTKEMQQELKHIIFDWGDTLMRDDPQKNTPMYLWDVVEEIEGAGHTLKELSESHEIHVATNVMCPEIVGQRIPLFDCGYVDSCD